MKYLFLDLDQTLITTDIREEEIKKRKELIDKQFELGNQFIMAQADLMTREIEFMENSERILLSKYINKETYNLVLKRPGLDEFMKYVSKHLNVSILTKADIPYAEEVCHKTGILPYINGIYSTRRPDIKPPNMSEEDREWLLIDDDFYPYKKYRLLGFELKDPSKIGDVEEIRKAIEECNNISSNHLIRIKMWSGELNDSALDVMKQLVTGYFSIK